MMKKIKIIAGVTWAFLCLIFIVMLFPGLNILSESAASLPFMKINPNYSGGEVSRQFVTANCTLDVRRPVFDGLIKERKKGFVQLDWYGNIPDKISDTIDYNFDQEPDFHIFVDRNNSETILDPISNKVKDIAISTPTSYGWTIRINLVK